VDFELAYSNEQAVFRAEVRAWFEREVPTSLQTRPQSPAESALQYADRRALGLKLGAKGWMYPSIPREYGGAGETLERVIVLEEESHRVGVSLPPYYDSGGKYGAASILAWGTEEQKQTFVPPICRGEVRTWQLLSEPSAGSDLAAVQTRAVRVGETYEITGQKVFVGSAHGAEQLWVITMTDPDAPRHHNLSWFMIDANLPGIEVVPQDLLSCHGEDESDIWGFKNTVYFDRVVVPASSLIGGENNGWKVAATHLGLEHGGRGTIRVHRIWSRLLEHCQTEIVDGRALIEHSTVRERLAEIYMRLEAVRLLGVRNFWLASQGNRMTYEGSQLAYLQKQTGLWLTEQIVELLGPAALTSDPQLGALGGAAERQQRDGIVDMHPGGTADIQKMLIARGLGLGR
jgi:3-oxocholest-4-en-26-oyl-CoA dehydrogenase alpha subunit